MHYCEEFQIFQQRWKSNNLNMEVTMIAVVIVLFHTRKTQLEYADVLFARDRTWHRKKHRNTVHEAIFRNYVESNLMLATLLSMKLRYHNWKMMLGFCHIRWLKLRGIKQITPQPRRINVIFPALKTKSLILLIL